MSFLKSLKTQKSLRDAREQEQKLYAAREKAVVTARKSGTNEVEINRIRNEEFWEARAYSFRVEVLETEILIDQARRYGVPIPPRSDDSDSFYFSNEGGGWVLSEEKAFELRKCVREEQKHAREVWQSWMGLSIGLLGAAIGVISVWPSS